VFRPVVNKLYEVKSVFFWHSEPPAFLVTLTSFALPRGANNRSAVDG
jgi:hypothetical protein